MKTDLAAMLDTARAIPSPWPCALTACAICRAVEREFARGSDLAERAIDHPMPQAVMRSQAAAHGWRARRYLLRTGEPLPAAKARAMARRILQAAHDAGRAL